MRRTNPSRATAIVLLMAALASFFSSACLRAEVPKVARPSIYDPSADVKAQIAAALQMAAGTNKSVLLMFGANWCPWCHKLHELFRMDDAVRRYLDDHFMLVMVDIGEKKGESLNQDVVEKYSIPVKEYGYPCLAVLDSRGKLLCSQSTGVLERNKAHDPQKVLAFLKLQIPQQ